MSEITCRVEAEWKHKYNGSVNQIAGDDAVIKTRTVGGNELKRVIVEDGETTYSIHYDGDGGTHLVRVNGFPGGEWTSLNIER